MTYYIDEISAMIGAERHGFCRSTIAWLLTDSRSLCFPSETLFFALKGQRNDGHDYVRSLFDRGVRNFVVSSLPQTMEEYPDCNFLLVKDTLAALQTLAARHRERFDIPVVGITGSNGKTVIKEWLYQLIEPDKTVARSPRSYNSQIGVPLSVWLLNQQTEIGFFEAGISKKDEMGKLWKMIRPTIGVLSNIGQAHQKNFQSLQEKCIEKLKLFKDCDVIIYDSDNTLIQDCVNKSVITAREIAWSRVNHEKPLFISGVETDSEKTTVRYRYIGIEGSYTIPFTDQASIENSLHCLAVCVYLMIPPQVIAERMAKLEPLAMRLEVKDGNHGCTIINDSYNSDLSSLGIALDFMARRGEGKKLGKTLILSDILQSGWSSAELYRKVARLVESRGIEHLIGIGQDIMSAEKQFGVPEKHFFATTGEFLKSDIPGRLRSQMVLVKGARVFQFEKIVERLELKVHETILEVNLQALADNLEHYRSMLKPETRIVCMVKASAYGAGAIEVARTLQERHVDFLAVAVADEGAELRRAGIATGIIVMNPERTSFGTLFEHKLEPEVYSFQLLEAIIRAAEHSGITNFPIHVKIDTGMHRLGFQPQDMPALVERLQRQTAVIPCSVFSHFVGSDSAQFDDFTRLQMERFIQAADTLQAAFKHHIIRHICNSAGIERYPQYHFDMVRLGLGLYGINPIDNSRLSTVSTLKTTILQIRTLEPGETVGYSRKGHIERTSRIAAIPIGYADGLDRHLGQGHAYCIVNGQKARYVGNICMDVCMIDVTDIDCQEGDSVQIFGPELPVSVLSDILETIPYEILTGVSTRVKRVYYME
ncbi:MAG: bifunctional UDP-N-acetylmuramoyl-tripeptide:D-alanyl-D-alanine ligase/alanine racemase [Bacteroidaceae bacterium]|nr:bifunctional UDP-N-acetylmuramoyl-tripeptide:D-alanyl-D-alanine ligase/alanine racemase [Bacteroidaceae bacterium]